MSFPDILETTQLGTVEINPKLIFTFPNGIPNFEHCRSWHLFHEEKNDPVIFWLQSLNDSDVMLNVIDPAALNVGYDISLTEDELQELEAQPDHTLAALLILDRANPGQKIQAQTNDPLIINLHTLRGLQKIGVQSISLPTTP